MPNWEYLQAGAYGPILGAWHIRSVNGKDVEVGKTPSEWLSEVGQQGWELVAVILVTNREEYYSREYFLKRPITS